MQIMIPCQATAMVLNSPRWPERQCKFHCVHYCAPLFQENLSPFIYASDKRRWWCSIFATMHFNGGQAGDTNGPTRFFVQIWKDEGCVFGLPVCVQTARLKTTVF